MKLILLLLLFPIIMVVQCTKEAEEVTTEEPTIFDEPGEETFGRPRFYRRPRNFTQVGPRSQNSTKQYSIAKFGTIPGIILINSKTPNGTFIGKLEAVDTKKTNRTLTFHLDTMSDFFSVDNSSGIITTKANLTSEHSYDGQIQEHCLDIGVTIEDDISDLGEQTDFCIRIISGPSFNVVKEDPVPGFLERLMLCLDIILMVGVAAFICGSVVSCLICRLRETRRSFTLPCPPEPSNKSETTSKTENPPASGAEPPTKTNREQEGQRTAPNGGTEGIEDRGSEDSVQLTTSTAKFTRARGTIGQGENGPESQDPAEAVVAATAEPSNQEMKRGGRNRRQKPAPKIPNENNGNGKN